MQNTLTTETFNLISDQNGETVKTIQAENLDHAIEMFLHNLGYSIFVDLSQETMMCNLIDSEGELEKTFSTYEGYDNALEALSILGYSVYPAECCVHEEECEEECDSIIDVDFR